MALSSWRDDVLRGLFALGIAWAAWGSVLVPLASSGAALLPGRSALLDALTIPIAALLGGTAAWLPARRWPGFLRASRSISLAALVVRFAWQLPLAFLALAALFATTEWIWTRATDDPTNPQYGLGVLWAAIWYPSFLAPALAAVTAWFSTRRG